MMLKLLLLVLSTIGLVLLIASRCINEKSILYIIDNPNSRSLHKLPTPRSGGIAIIATVVLIWAITMLSQNIGFIWLLGPVMLLATIGVFDDIRGISTLLRLIVHVSCAFMLLYAGIGLTKLHLPGIEVILPLWFSAIITVVFVVWMVNLYNFMDGMDGFAGGMTFIGFATFAILGYTKGADGFALLALTVSVAALGFLYFNFPPARLFMGDSGSATLGFIAATFMLWADRDRIFPLWTGVLVFSPFIVDASITLVKRTLRGEKIWQAHRSHYYQRLVTNGWSHKRTVVFEYFLMLVCSGFAIIAVRFDKTVEWLVVVLSILLYSMLFVIFHKIYNETDQ